jgi:hypothetical protein
MSLLHLVGPPPTLLDGRPLLLKGLQADNSCTLCSQEPELVNHLVIQRVFSREVWFSALRRCDWHHLAPSADDSVTWWVHSMKQVAKEHRKSFDSLIIAIAWSIWLERNERCFLRRLELS